MFGDFSKAELGLEQLVQMMAGGAELENLAHELERAAGSAEGETSEELARAAEALEFQAKAAEVDAVAAEPVAVEPQTPPVVEPVASPVAEPVTPVGDEAPTVVETPRTEPTETEGKGSDPGP